MQAEPQVVREGWLTKAPSQRNWLRFWDTNWKRRYFVLRSGDVPGDTCLVWYPDENHRRNGKPKGTIHLQDCEQVDCNLSLQYERRNKRVFYKWIFDVRVNTPKGSVLYYFSAPSEDAMNAWVRDLCQVCHLERDGSSDGSAEDRDATTTGAPVHMVNHHQPPEINHNDPRYVTQPPAHLSRPLIPPNPSPQPRQQNQNGVAHAGTPSPMTSLNRPQKTTTPPINKPPAPLPAPLSAPLPVPPPPEPQRSPQPPLEEPNTAGVPMKKEGYIPLAECLSDPSAVESPTQQPNPATDVETPTVNVSADFENLDQPPSYPPPPLPKEDGACQHIPAPQPHSRSPSKDSSASSIHLSSTESEQGDNRRPSVGKPFGTVETPNYGDTPVTPGPITSVPSGPTSPISPAAPLCQRLPRSSEGSTASCVIEDLSPKPPPRPPKTSRSSISSNGNGRPMYENKPPPMNDGPESFKYLKYDQISFSQRDIVFGTLPATTKAMLGGGRRSQDSNFGFAQSPSPFSTLRKGADSSTGTHFFGQDTLPSTTPDQVSDSHTLHTSTCVLQDTNDLSYAGVTISHSRLTSSPAMPMHSRSHSSDAEANGNGGDQYQNFTPPPRSAQTNRVGVPATPQNPPEVKRELKPGARNRGPSLPNAGVSQLPKLPDRLTDPRKGSLGSNVGASAKETGASNETNGEQHMPQFNVERQVSFKSRPKNLGQRQQTAPSLGGIPTGGFMKPGSLKGILDSEVKLEDYPQLEYITPASVRAQMTPPGTPSSTMRRNISGVRSSPCPSSSPSQSTLSEHMSNVNITTTTGYVQIDPKATQAIGKLMQEREQRNRNQHQPQPPSSDGGTLRKK